MKVLAIIPARGGSKRVPKKNIKPFFGQPMIGYAIKKAFESSVFIDVIISTDSLEIAKIGESFGAKVPFLRPKELADDYASTIDVINHAIKECEKIVDFDALCCIYPCVPLMRVADLQKGFEVFSKKQYDFVISALRYGYSPFRAFTKKECGLSMLFPQFLQTRSQDLEPIYHDAAQFYFGKKEAFLSKESIFGEKSTFVEIPENYVQDIDTPEDWEIATRKYQTLLQENL